MRTFTHFSFAKKWRLCSLLLVGTVMFLASAKAQVAGYSFSQTSGTYTPITGGVTFANADDVIYSGSIGFNFVLNGVTYTTLNISTNGFVTFGATSPGTTNYTPISSTTGYNAAVSPFGRDMIGNTGSELRAETVGNAPNRTYVVQWKDWRRYDLGAVSGDALNFQVRLNETTNTIDIVYGSNVATNTTARTCQVGLRGATNSDFSNRSTATDWTATTAGTVNTATCTSSNTIMPPSGLTFTWTPPPPCMGTPNGGTTTVSANPVCSGVNFTLGLSGSTQGTGITYQWQSSTNGISYTNISGATSSTLTTSQTSATWYHCVVTCTASGQSANSTDLFVDMAPPTQCYCIPVYTSGCGASDRIDKVTFGVLVNPPSGNSGCTNNNGVGYNQYLTGLPVPNLAVGSTYPISVLVGPGGTEHVKIFIDINQDGDFFDTGEETYIGSGNGVTISGNVTVPAGSLTGQTRMRVRVVYNTSSFGPCTSHSFGEAEDYLVNIIAPPSCLANPIAPANGASSCPPAGNTTLSWPTAAGATSYDVYFGTSSNPPFVTNTTTTTYNAGVLGFGTYYWKIVPKNDAGAATGCPVWSFIYADNQAPVISNCGGNKTLFANSNCQATLGNYTSGVSYTDNCSGLVTVAQSPAAGTIISGNTTITFTVTDAAGNSSTCSVTANLVDNTAPSFNNCANIQVGTSSNACNAVVNFTITASDNCDNNVSVTQTSGPASGSTFNLGSTALAFTAVDDAGNTKTCALSVIVSDDDGPVISVCPPNATVTTDENCEAVTADYTGLVVASDNCGGAVTVTQNPAPGTISGGFLTITMIATDGAGNSSTCTFQTLSSDITSPTISCPDPQYFNADDDCQTPLPDFTSLANASDNCGGFVVTQSPAAGTEVGFGQTILTLTVTDGAGLSASCTMQAYAVDVTPPVITCPDDQTLNTDPNTCTAVAMFMCPVAPDNCSGSANPEQFLGLPSGSAFPLGVNVVGFQATDASGNTSTCTFTITVVDNDPPYLSCPFNIVKNTDPGLCSAVTTWSVPTTHDNCGIPTLVQTAGPTNGSAFPKGTTTVAFKSTDAAGNTTTCSFTVTVIDNENPVITCPANIVKSNDLNQCGAIVTYPNPTFSDNCPGATIMLVSGLPSGSFFPVGTTTNVWKVTDAVGNTATCSFTVTVNDTQLPTITCPANIVKNNDPNQCGAIVTYPNPTFSDNCPGATIMLVSGLPSGSFFPVGITTNVWKVTDAAGNMATCSFTVRVNDVQPPVFNNCPGNITKPNDPGVCGAVVTWPKITASDNCPGVVVTFVSGMASGSLFDVGITTVIYKATDASGNMATCSFNVIVLDNEDPVITCPADIVKNNDYNKCSATIAYIGTATATDNCSIKSITSNATGNVYPVGVTTITWTAVDASNNDATCQQTITVVDAQFPTLICPSDIHAIAIPDLCQAEVDYEATYSDNCPGVTIEYSEWPPSDNGLFSLGNTMVMATATDAAGNQLMCQFCIHVEGAPEICNGLDDDCDGFIDETDDAWRQADKQLASNGQGGDLYGASVAVSGSYAVVGAKNADTKGTNSGTAYVLLQSEINPDNWEQVAVLDAPGVGADDLFGVSAAIHTDWIVVGASQDDDLGDDAGAAYIFKKGATPSAWTLVKKITAADGFAGDNFGVTVSINGDNLLVGASRNDEKGQNAGAAYLFSKNQGGADNWGQVAKLTAADGQGGAAFGASLELDGDFAIIGASFDDNNNLTNKGAAYLFAKNQGGPNAWGQVKKLVANDGAEFDNFGMSVGISDKAVIVGANLDDDRGNNSGSAYIFERNLGGTDNWGQAAKLLANDGTASDQLGYVVAIDDDFAVAGARFDNIKGTNSGAAYIWERQSNGTWEFVSKINDQQGDKNDQFATALDIYKRIIMVGTPLDDVAGKADQGSVAFFTAGCDDNFIGNPDDVAKGNASKIGKFEVKAFPQPFSDVLNIEIAVKAASNARVVVWNNFGQEVATIYTGALEGNTILRWNSEGFAAGAYFLRVEADNETEVKSILLVR